MSKPRKAKPFQAVIEAFCESSGFPKPTTEHRFHPERKWSFDFAFIAQRIAIEIDGGVYAFGRHTRGKGFENDCEKFGEAVSLGWRVLRLSTGQLKKGLCFPWLECLFKNEFHYARLE